MNENTKKILDKYVDTGRLTLGEVGILRSELSRDKGERLHEGEVLLILFGLGAMSAQLRSGNKAS